MVRRSFTILETVLAAALSSLVVLGCLGGFMALNRSDRTLAARFHEANDLARIQKTMQRAFSTLLMAPDSPLDEEEEDAEADTTNQEQPAADAEDQTTEDEIVYIPRIVLEQDDDPFLTSILQNSRFNAASSGGAVATPQRLELVLSAVPIRPPAVQSSVWTEALVGVDDLDEPTDETEEEYAGVRGAFVLRPDDPDSMESLAREASNDERIGWTLWWQPIDSRSQPARVASGLAMCQFQVFRDREMQSAILAYTPEEMPTYIQLEVETLSGLYANYLFEVVWTVDQIDDEQETTAGSGGGGGGQGGQGGPNGQAGDGQNGGPNGFRGGGQGRDPRARPRPNAPQSGNPGRQIDGQPRQIRPPTDGAGGPPPPGGPPPRGPGGPGNGGGGGGS